MSSRVRIFLWNSSNGQILVGNAGLKQLQELAVTSIPGQWVPYTGFESSILTTKVDPTTGKFIAYTKSRQSPSPSLEPPMGLPTWRRAIWLWERLSPSAREVFHLIIVRDSRHAPWAKSRANPKVYGLKTPKDPFSSPFYGALLRNRNTSPSPKSPRRVLQSDVTVPTDAATPKWRFRGGIWA